MPARLQGILARRGLNGFPSEGALSRPVFVWRAWPFLSSLCMGSPRGRALAGPHPEEAPHMEDFGIDAEPSPATWLLSRLDAVGHIHDEPSPSG